MKKFASKYKYIYLNKYFNPAFSPVTICCPKGQISIDLYIFSHLLVKYSTSNWCGLNQWIVFWLQFETDHHIYVMTIIFKVTFLKVNHSVSCCQEDSLYCSSRGATDKIIWRKDNWSLLNFKTHLLSFAIFWQMEKWQFRLVPQRLNKWKGGGGHWRASVTELTPPFS